MTSILDSMAPEYTGIVLTSEVVSSIPVNKLSTSHLFLIIFRRIIVKSAIANLLERLK
ncbi:hypothetical protein D3C80_1108910 [compost metagenome]